MPATIAANEYGKQSVRLVKVTRAGTRHSIKDFEVGIRLEGRFDEVYRAGDNRPVLPTDTMKNTVYALAAQMDVNHPEQFATTLADHFLEVTAAATTATVEIVEHPWSRIEVGGRVHDSAFIRPSVERRIATVSGGRNALITEAGIDQLTVMKTSRSAFAGFKRDRYTTLKETTDRLFATAIDARWRYDRGATSFGTRWHAVRRLLLEAFAEHDSKSVQHTLYAMGEVVLNECADIVEIRLSMPNKHHLLVDLGPFGLENENEIFVATSEPYGLISAVLRRE
jgi:urate oxidase